MAKFKYHPRKVKTREIIRFRGITDSDGAHNTPLQFVESANNLSSVKIREMNTRDGEERKDSYSGGVNTGDSFQISRLIGEGNNIWAETLSVLSRQPTTIYPPPPVVHPPPLPKIPGLPKAPDTTESSFIFTVEGFYESGGGVWYQTVTLPTAPSGLYNYHVDWGDGSSDDITTWNDANRIHAYASATTRYTITISGQFTVFDMTVVGVMTYDTLYYRTVENIGNTGFTILNFSDCSNLTDFTAGDSDTSSLEIIDWLFSACYNLANLDMSGMDFSSVVSADSCAAVVGYSTSLVIDSWPLDMSSCQFFYQAFFGSRLSPTVFAGLDVSSGEDFEAFVFGSEITSLDFSSWNCPNATSFIDFARNVTGLTTVTFGSFVIPDSSDVSTMFQDCPALTSAMPSGLFWGNATLINHTRCFYGSTLISNYASIPSGWK